MTQPVLRIADILAAADAFQQRWQRWPKREDGPVPGMPDITWQMINLALREGRGGLRGGCSLARLLHQCRGVRHQGLLPPLSEARILRWADAHHSRTGMWPTVTSGKVVGAPNETWEGINKALRRGSRGVREGSSLARLLHQHRSVRHQRLLSPLSETQILRWADAHHKRTGTWPTRKSGKVIGVPQESWYSIHQALSLGRRQLPGGSSLQKLLTRHRGVRHPTHTPPLSPEQVLAWAEAHFQRTGTWPTRRSGAIAEAPSETWAAVDAALVYECRGLAGYRTLRRFLARRRGVRHPKNLPSLTLAQVRTWVLSFQQRSGKLPKYTSGRVREAPGETWNGVLSALYKGSRGLPRSSLRQLLQQQPLPRLRLAQVRVWVLSFQQRTGKLPQYKSGPVREAPGETWSGVLSALYKGRRGLPRSSLSQLLQ